MNECFTRYSEDRTLALLKGNCVPTENRSDLDEGISAAIKDVDVIDTLSHLLRCAHFRNEFLFTSVFSETGLTSRQMVLLATIAQNPGVSQRAIGNILALDVNTVSDTLRRMERKRLIERVASKEDGRSVAVRLSAPGLKALKRGLSLAPQLQAQIVERLDQDEAANLKSLLKKLLS